MEVRQGRALGSPLRLITATDANARDVDLAWQDIQAAFDKVDRTMSRFRRDSELTQLNRRDGRAAQCSRLLASALALSERARRVTAGRFDHAVAMAKVAVRTAPSRESARRALIEAYVAQGDLAAAVNAYDEYQELLRSSVGGPVGHGLDGLFPTAPAWPVLRARSMMPRSAVQLPGGVRAVRSGRRLVAGGAAPGYPR